MVVDGAPTRLGRVNFEIRSHLGENRVTTDLQLPPAGIKAPARLRLRVPEGYSLKSARVDGRDWSNFNPQEETVTLQAGAAGKVKIEAFYQRN
jgi:hypothetical protein